MKLKKLFITVVILFLTTTLVFSQQSTVIEKVKEKIKGIRVTNSINKTTAIAGVRGAEEKEDATLFWYGKDSIAKEELDLFQSGLDKLEKGDASSARSIFEMFLNKYPKSVLSPDAYEVIKTLKN